MRCFEIYSNFDVILKYQKQKSTKTNQRVYKMSHSFLKEKEMSVGLFWYRFVCVVGVTVSMSAACDTVGLGMFQLPAYLNLGFLWPYFSGVRIFVQRSEIGSRTHAGHDTRDSPNRTKWKSC